MEAKSWIQRDSHRRTPALPLTLSLVAGPPSSQEVPDGDSRADSRGSGATPLHSHQLSHGSAERDSGDRCAHLSCPTRGAGGVHPKAAARLANTGRATPNLIA